MKKIVVNVIPLVIFITAIVLGFFVMKHVNFPSGIVVAMFLGGCSILSWMVMNSKGIYKVTPEAEDKPEPVTPCNTEPISAKEAYLCGEEARILAIEAEIKAKEKFTNKMFKDIQDTAKQGNTEIRYVIGGFYGVNENHIDRSMLEAMGYKFEREYNSFGGVFITISWDNTEHPDNTQQSDSN